MTLNFTVHLTFTAPVKSNSMARQEIYFKPIILNYIWSWLDGTHSAERVRFMG